MYAQRFSCWLPFSFLALLALTSAVGVRSASAEGAPIGGCPPDFFLFRVSQLPPTSGLESVDINGDGWTCVKLIADKNPKGQRFVAVDNVTPFD